MRVDDIWRFNVCSSLESSEISCIILYNHIHINIYIHTYYIILHIKKEEQHVLETKYSTYIALLH